MYLIAGLGNPGPQYENTRHNMGMKTVQKWSNSLGVPLQVGGFRSKHARANFRGNQLVLLCPLTYMNLSGEPVRDCLHHYGMAVDDLVVIHDDLDLPFGRIKVARNGGAGGHKGVTSIIACLQSTHFLRVKIGIGRPQREEAIVDYVLNGFYDDEMERVTDVVQLAIEACELIVLEGVETAMNRINCRRSTI